MTSHSSEIIAESIAAARLNAPRMLREVDAGGNIIETPISEEEFWVRVDETNQKARAYFEKREGKHKERITRIFEDAGCFRPTGTDRMF